MDTQYNRPTSWKIIYSQYEGVERRAIELISREAGERIIREPEVYRLHVLPCERESENTVIEHSAIVIGTYGESSLVRRFISESELPDGAYAVKVLRNPSCAGGSIVVIAARCAKHLYLAAATFIDDYSMIHSPKSGSLILRHELYTAPLAEALIVRRPKIETRSIFAWGHPINDYRGFISDSARVGINQIILWNDYAPINAKEIVEYAHSFGIEVIWGYAWGWCEGQCENAKDIEPETLKNLKKQIVEQYDTVWRGLGDGIYFQSFTEKNVDKIGNRSIAEAVVALVNDVAEALYERDPELHIQFGLHATSVKNELDKIAAVDKRIEIVWEDCGAFPYAYMPQHVSEEELNSALSFTEKIIKLRGDDARTGLVFKGFAILDWSRSRFVHQRGPFILGDGSPLLLEHDRRLRSDSWRRYTAAWLRYGEYARKVAEYAYKLTDGRINLCMAGLFDGALWAPFAMCSSIFEDPTESFDDIAERVMKRKNVKID